MPALQLDRIIARLLASVSPGNTVVLENELEECYRGVVDGAPAAVDLIVTGSYTVPVGGTLVLKVLKQNPDNPASFAEITTTQAIDSAGVVTITIPSTSHGITSATECGLFLFQPSVTFPAGGPRTKYFDGQSFQICPTCPT